MGIYLLGYTNFRSVTTISGILMVLDCLKNGTESSNLGREMAVCQPFLIVLSSSAGTN
jgi:hypothetical protein